MAAFPTSQIDLPDLLVSVGVSKKGRALKIPAWRHDRQMAAYLELSVQCEE